MTDFNYTVNYELELITKAVHLFSGTTIYTDAPLDNNGKASSFSPTDLVCSSLGSCMITIMGITANTHNINLEGMNIEVTKFMTTSLPRKISKVKVEFHFGDQKYSEKDQQMLQNAANTCPVALSLHPDIEQEVVFNF